MISTEGLSCFNLFNKLIPLCSHFAEYNYQTIIIQGFCHRDIIINKMFVLKRTTKMNSLCKGKFLNLKRFTYYFLLHKKAKKGIIFTTMWSHPMLWSNLYGLYTVSANIPERKLCTSQTHTKIALRIWWNCSNHTYEGFGKCNVQRIFLLWSSLQSAQLKMILPLGPKLVISMTTFICIWLRRSRV